MIAFDLFLLLGPTEPIIHLLEVENVKICLLFFTKYFSGNFILLASCTEELGKAADFTGHRRGQRSAVDSFRSM